MNVNGSSVERFGLRDAVVVPAGGRGEIKEELGAAAAAYFEKVTASGSRVGLSCGFTLYHTIHHLKEHRFRDLTLYPLRGRARSGWWISRPTPWWG